MDAYVVAMIGLPGSGKSTVARWLMRHFDLHEVNRDTIRAAMFPRCAFSVPEKQAAEHAVMLSVEVNCGAGRNSIVDGMTFADNGSLTRLARTCYPFQYEVVPLWLDCTVETACDRVGVTDGHPAADRDSGLVSAVARRFQPPPADAIRIDATRSVSEVCDRSLEALRARVSAAPGKK